MIKAELISKLCECYTDHENDIEKYSACLVQLEITRRCNLNCIHCCKGDSQDIDMDPKYIDSTLDQIDTIYHLSIAGGEPTLVPDLLKYVLESLKRHETKVEKISITTNAVILSEEFRNLFDEFRAYATRPSTCRIIISTDVFHKKASSLNDIELENHCKFYRKGRKNIVLKQDCAKIYGTLFRVGRLARPPKVDYMRMNTDRAYYNLYREKLKAYSLGISQKLNRVPLKYFGKHLCMIEITAIGNVITHDVISYDDEDSDNFFNGNILDGLDRIINQESQDTFNIFLNYLLDLKSAHDAIQNMIHSGIMGTTLFAKVDIKVLKEKIYILRELIIILIELSDCIMILENNARKDMYQREIKEFENLKDSNIIDALDNAIIELEKTS